MAVSLTIGDGWGLCGDACLGHSFFKGWYGKHRERFIQRLRTLAVEYRYPVDWCVFTLRQAYPDHRRKITLRIIAAIAKQEGIRIRTYARDSIIRSEPTEGKEIVATTDRYGRPRGPLPTFGSHEHDVDAAADDLYVVEPPERKPKKRTPTAVRYQARRYCGEKDCGRRVYASF